MGSGPGGDPLGGASRRSIASFERDGKKGNGPARAPEFKARVRELLDDEAWQTRSAAHPRLTNGLSMDARKMSQSGNMVLH
jgi:hypothetical protein